MVRATVIDEIGQPYANITVLFDGVVTTTNAEGRFELANVAERYDVTLRAPSGQARAYQGLSSRTPTFKIDNSYSSQASSRYAELVVQLPEADSESIESTLIAGLDGAATSPGFSFNFPGGAAERPHGVRWRGDETVELVLDAFGYEVDPTTGGPARYLRSAELRRPITSGEPVTWVVEWVPMAYPTATIDASVTLPDGYDIGNARVSAALTPASGPFWFLTASPPTHDVSMLVPDLPGATFELSILTAGNGSNSIRRISGITSSSPVVEVNVEPGPVPLSPAEDAGNVGMDSAFSWESGGDGVAFLNILPTDIDAMHPEYFITTAGSQARIPDLSVFGVEFPHGATYEWAVFVTTAPSVDELAAHGTEIQGLPQSTYAYSGYQGFSTR